MRFILVKIALALFCAQISTLTLAADSTGPVRPGTLFLSAYQTVSEAKKCEQDQKYKQAWENYHQALKYYQSLAASFPAWKPELVHRRIELTSKAIKDVEPKAQQVVLAEKAKLQHLITDENSFAQIPDPTTTNVLQDEQLSQLTRMNQRINAQQQELNQLKKKHSQEASLYQQKIVELQKKLQDSQRGLGIESNQSRLLNQEIAKLQRELKRSRELGKNDQQKLLSTIEELQQTRTKLATAPLRADVEKLRQIKAQQEKELKFLVNAHRNATKKIELKTIENQKLSKELAETKLELKLKVQSLESAKTNTANVVASMRQEISSLKRKLSNAENTIARQKDEIADLIDRVAQSEILTDELREELTNVTAERDQLSSMLKLSDADRAQELMRENLRLGRELSTAKQHLKQLHSDKNVALDRVTEAENSLAIAKHQLILKRQENAEFRKRISQLESRLKQTQEQLIASNNAPQDDPAAREEAEILKKTVNRLIAQSSRRRQAERLLWMEYQKLAPASSSFTKEYLEIAGEDIQLTERERQVVLEHQSESTLRSPLTGSNRFDQQIAKAKADERISTFHTIATKLVSKGQLEFAQDIYDEAYDSIPDFSFLVNRGVIRMRLQNYNEAEEIFELSTSQRPRNPYSHFMLGMTRFHLEDDDLASKSIEQAITLKPDYKEAILYRGIIEGRNHRYQSAIEHFNNAIELDPNFEAAHFNLSIIYNMMGNNKQAIKAYNNALRAGLAPNQNFEKKIGI
ncbi:tetratricopeptide repeat protein [Rubritalea marina]|uniref:tetratricopeptide repeat protein n=1 Tax=Rubritalea marina TaxID=361055 RepID=UPI000371639A|nr:tetratricopeptide repeat protein [Rubritalea marina]